MTSSPIVSYVSISSAMASLWSTKGLRMGRVCWGRSGLRDEPMADRSRDSSTATTWKSVGKQPVNICLMWSSHLESLCLLRENILRMPVRRKPSISGSLSRHGMRWTCLRYGRRQVLCLALRGQAWHMTHGVLVRWLLLWNKDCRYIDTICIQVHAERNWSGHQSEGRKRTCFESPQGGSNLHTQFFFFFWATSDERYPHTQTNTHYVANLPRIRFVCFWLFFFFFFLLLCFFRWHFPLFCR